jgi:hypothetical protein
MEDFIMKQRKILAFLLTLAMIVTMTSLIAMTVSANDPPAPSGFDITGTVNFRAFGATGDGSALIGAIVTLQRRGGTAVTDVWDDAGDDFVANNTAVTGPGGSFTITNATPTSLPAQYRLRVTAPGHVTVETEPFTLTNADEGARGTIIMEALGISANSVVISGRAGTPIAPQTVTITTNDVFVNVNPAGAGTPVSEWFTNMPEGLEANVTAVQRTGTGTTDPINGVTVTFTGIAAETSLGEGMNIGIPRTFFDNAVEGAVYTVSGEADADPRFRIIAAVDGTDPRAGNVIIWGDGENIHIGLDLTREILVIQDEAAGTIGDYTTTIQAFTNNRGRWTAVRDGRQAFAGHATLANVLPNLLNRGWSNRIIVSTSPIIRDRAAADTAGVKRGEPAMTGRITFTGTVNGRLRFGAGTRYTVNYSADANATWTCDLGYAEPTGDYWILTARGQEMNPADKNFLDTVQVYLVDNADRRARTRDWTMFASMTTLPSGVGPSTTAFKNIRPISGDNKVTRDNIVVRTIAVDNGNNNYSPASREQRYSILGAGRAPFRDNKLPEPREKTPLLLNLRKGFEVIGAVENVENAGSFTVVASTAASFNFTMTDKAITFLRPDTVPLPQLDGTITVRIAATPRRPASMPNTIPVSLPAVEVTAPS